VRDIVRQDLPKILKIEASSFEFHWSEEDFINCLRRNNCDCLVAECKDRIVGFVVAEFDEANIHVTNLAVDGNFRRLGVGSQLMAEVIEGYGNGRFNIVLEVRETNLPAQLFFRRMGFRAVSILRRFYPNTPEEDAYRMRLRLKPHVLTTTA